MPKLASLLILISLLAEKSLEAQSPRLPFKRLSIEDGLSQGTVNCILQDSTGFLWLGTQDGLNRYDGYGFEVYKKDPTDPASLPASWIEALVESDSGDLWIGTQGGLARWRRAIGAFERFRHDSEDPASLPADSVRALHVDRDGSLWIGTFQSGLARLDPVTGSVERFRHDPEDPASLSDDRVRALYQDRAGHLWVGTLGGLDRLDREGRSFTVFRHRPDDPSSLSDDRVFAILEDTEGTLWVGTEGGLNRSREPGPGFVRYRHDPDDPASLADDWVTGLLEDRAGRLWIATDGGFHRRHPEGDTFERYRHDARDPLSLSNDRLLALFEDRAGLIWIGTQGGGTSRYNPASEGFVHYRADTAGGGGLSSNSVFAFSEDPEGQLWIGTLGGGLDIRTADGFRNLRHNPADPGSLGDDKVSALLHDRAGTLWVGTFGSGLSRRDRGSETFQHYRSGPVVPGTLSDNVVTSLHEDRDGVLWVGTQRGGLNYLHRDPVKNIAAESFRHLRHDPENPESLGEDQITSFAEDEEALWIGTFGGGLDRLEPDPRPADGSGSSIFRHFRHNSENSASLSSDTVFALHYDAAGNLWVGTQVGLNRLVSLEDSRFEHYFERDGLPNDVIWGIESDGDGRLWISTNNGLARFDPQTETFKKYTASHGLQSNEFNFGAHFRSASGELFFGGVNGFNAFYPDRIETNSTAPPVVVTAFSKRNQPARFDRPVFDVDAVTLDYRDYFFDIEFAALDFTAPAENRYRYKLEGFDTQWIDIGHRRRVSFSNLDSGSYVLRLQGSNNDGVWNEEGVSLAITVEPPPWQTWWAYMIYALSLGTALGAFVFFQDRRLERERGRLREKAQHLREREHLVSEIERKNAELERFTYTASHDLRTPLVTIKGFLGLLAKDVRQGDAESIRKDIGEIGEAADRMSTLLDDLLEFARLGRQITQTDLVSLGQLATEAQELLDGLIAARGVEVEISPELPVVIGDRLRLLSVFQNLLENAVKYMGGQQTPRVEVGVRQGDGEPVAYVRDNGIGIEPRYLEKVFGLFERLDAADAGTGLGLALTRRIIEAHGGRIWAESEGLGHGSTFCFVLHQQPGPEAVGEGSEELASEPVPA